MYEREANSEPLLFIIFQYSLVHKYSSLIEYENAKLNDVRVDNH